MEEKKDYRAELFYEQKNGYDSLSLEGREAMDAYCEGYKRYLNESRTERESVRNARGHAACRKICDQNFCHIVLLAAARFLRAAALLHLDDTTRARQSKILIFYRHLCAQDISPVAANTARRALPFRFLL